MGRQTGNIGRIDYGNGERESSGFPASPADTEENALMDDSLRLLQEKSLSSRQRIYGEISAYLLETEKLEQRLRNLTPGETREISDHRLSFMDSLSIAIRGQNPRVICLCLREEGREYAMPPDSPTRVAIPCRRAAFKTCLAIYWELIAYLLALELCEKEAACTSASSVLRQLHTLRQDFLRDLERSIYEGYLVLLKHNNPNV